MKNIKFVLALFASVVVTACGGGGSSGLSSSNIPLYIGSNNMQAITATAIKTASGTTFDLFNPDNFATDIYDALLAGAVINTPCANNGSNVAVDLTTNTGTMVYSNCVIAGNTFNGTVYLHNSTLDTNTDTLSSSLTFNSLTVNTGSGFVTLTGGYNLTATGLGTTYPFTFGANGITLTLTSNSGGTEVISNFDFVTNVATALTSTYKSDFNLASSILDGSFSHQSDASLPYEINSATISPYPYSGDAVILGANQTQLRVSVIGNGNIGLDQIQVDRSIDGGNNYLFAVDYTWAQLYP